MDDKRESWHDYFMAIAKKAASRSTCLRRKVGAVAVNRRHRIIATGYNGAPSGMSHCTKDTCIRIQRNIPSGTQLDLCKAIHAEANMVLQLGEQLEGATVYCTNKPCTGCLKLLMGAGVDAIYWLNDYPDDYSDELMGEYGALYESKLSSGEEICGLKRKGLVIDQHAHIWGDDSNGEYIDEYDD